jgi:hypothetical protein
MNILRRDYLLLLMLSFTLYSCGGGSGDEQAAQQEAENTMTETATRTAEQTAQEAMKEVQKQMNGDGEAKEVIDFRKLKELLPASVAGMERTSHTGEKVGAMGFKMSTAEAKYESGDSRLEVNIIDFAGVGMAMMSLASWSSMEVDRETDTGYERTTVIDGYKAFEEYDRERKDGQISIITGERFIVTIEGKNVEERAMRDALDAIDIDALVSMEE